MSGSCMDFQDNVRATLKHRGGYTVTWADRGENQREKSKVSILPVSPYYTMLSCARTHYLVHTDPMLRGPLTDSGCMCASYFTSTVTLEEKAEWSSDLRAEWSSNSKSRAEQSSDLGVGWNLEQRKCEMGCPLTDKWFLIRALNSLWNSCRNSTASSELSWQPPQLAIHKVMDRQSKSTKSWSSTSNSV